MDLNRLCVFENSNWTAAEEKSLLIAIEELGYGNWANISRRLVSRSAADCETHYNSFYINTPSDLLPKFPRHEILLPTIITPYSYRLKNIEEPPRCTPASVTYNNLAGYSAARSEFEYPYDSGAEALVSLLSDNVPDEDLPEDRILNELTCGVFRAYNNRLRERQRRYEVIRNYGLVLTRKQICMHRRDTSLPRHVLEKFIGFTQLLLPQDFDFIMESLHWQTELKGYLYRLSDLRARGIKTFHGARLYYKLKKERDSFFTDIQSYFLRSEISLGKAQDDSDLSAGHVSMNLKRSVAAPLDIIGLPGYDRLTAEERITCSKVRLVPESYLEFKHVLISEYKKLGSLRLQDARKAIRIDVNKTRKLYDFLIEQGHISNS